MVIHVMDRGHVFAQQISQIGLEHVAVHRLRDVAQEDGVVLGRGTAQIALAQFDVHCVLVMKQVQHERNQQISHHKGDPQQARTIGDVGQGQALELA